MREMSSDFKNRSSKIKKIVTKYIEDKDIPDNSDPLIILFDHLIEKNCKGTTPLKDFIEYTTCSQRTYYSYRNGYFVAHPEITTLTKICIGLGLDYEECILLFTFSGYSFDYHSYLNIKILDLIDFITNPNFLEKSSIEKYQALITSDIGSYFNLNLEKLFRQFDKD